MDGLGISVTGVLVSAMTTVTFEETTKRGNPGWARHDGLRSTGSVSVTRMDARRWIPPSRGLWCLRRVNLQPVGEGRKKICHEPGLNG